MRDLKLEMVPKPVYELLEQKLDSALQMLAALVLTDEEVLSIRLQDDPELRPENMTGWAQGMKEELLDETWRPQLVDALRRSGFLTNSHPGFPLAAFEAPTNHRALARGYLEIEKGAQEHANGEGESPDPNELEKIWKERLGKSYAQELVTYMLRNGGFTLLLDAILERIMRPVRAKQDAEKNTWAKYETDLIAYDKARDTYEMDMARYSVHVAQRKLDNKLGKR